MRDSLRFIVYVLYCLEGGGFLALVPWTQVWQENFYFQRWPALAAIGLHPAVRGMVSAAGVVLFLHGGIELFRLFLRGLRAREARP